MKRYQALILDFGGVLTSDFFEALRGFCRREGLPDNALELLISSDSGGRGLLVDLERGALGQLEFEEQLAALLNVRREGLLQRIAADLKPEKRMLDACAVLREHGVRVGVLSNSWGSEPFDPYAPWELERNFDAVVVSDKVGLRKPDPAIFALAIERVGSPAEQCLFVDDIAVYLEPARAMGMGVLHHTSVDRTLTELERLFEVSLQR